MRSFVIATFLLFISSVSAANVITEVNDPSLSGSVEPNEVSGNSGSFFIINGNDPITGPGSIVGWYYTPGSPPLEIVDNELSGSARPIQVVTNPSGHFFIINNDTIGDSGGVVGWYYAPGSPIMEAKDGNPMASTAYANYVAASENGTFFISNGSGFVASTSDGLIGWLYTPGSSIVEITDASTPSDTVSPNVVAAGISGDFFIANSYSISSPGSIIGWYYTTGTTATEVTDASLGQMAGSGLVAANGAGNFFITNEYGATETDKLIGWYYIAGAPSATEVPDISLLHSAYPGSVASDTSNSFFIANNVFGPTIDPSFPLVGWYYVPGTSSAEEVKDPDLMGSASPGALSGNGSQYFISNASSLEGSGQLIGWDYTPGFLNAVEVTDPGTVPMNTYPYPVAAHDGGNFFIANDGNSVGESGYIVGWYYVPGSPIVEAIDSNASPSGSYGIAVAANGAGYFFISNGNNITGATPLIGWYYGPPLSAPRSFKRPNNRR